MEKKITPIEWLKNHLAKINDLPVLELCELNDSDIGFEDAQKITEGPLYEKDLVSGEYNSDLDEMEEHEFEYAMSLFAIRRNTESSNYYKPQFIFSSTDEDESEDRYIELAKNELASADLLEFKKLFPNY